MKKILITLLLFVNFGFWANSQLKADDIGKIILHLYVPDKVILTKDAKESLVMALNRIANNKGIISSEANSRFIITASVSIATKDIIAGPPQLIAESIELNLFIGDAIKNIIFSNTQIILKGVGTNENKALINAMNAVNPKSSLIESFLEDSKNKIISYYNTHCDQMIKQANLLAKQEKFNEAIYSLSMVPDACTDCYSKSLNAISNIYQRKVNAECKVKFNKAKAIWASGENSANAEKAGNIISTISPMSSCQQEVSSFITEINNKLKADEQAKWQFKMKQYADNIAMEKENIKNAAEQAKRDDEYREKQAARNAISQEKQEARNHELENTRINAFKEVAVEYAKNQPKEVYYSNIYWK